MNRLIPFNPNNPQFLWFQAWRHHIKNAKRFPEQAIGYCEGAKLAQKEYLCLTAQLMVERYY